MIDYLNKELYIKKENGRYQKINKSFYDINMLPTDKEIVILRYKENAKKFNYREQPILPEYLDVLINNIELFKTKLANFLMEEMHYKLKKQTNEGFKSSPLTKEEIEAYDNLKEKLKPFDFHLIQESKDKITENAVDKMMDWLLNPKSNNN